MNVGERIKTIRKDAGLNQTEFGERVGLKQTSIAMYEKGERQVSNQSITLISKAFHVREEWLRTGEEPKDMPRIASLLDDTELTEIDRVIIGHYLTLSEQQRQAVKDFIMHLAADFSKILAAAPSDPVRAEKEKQLAEHEQQAAALRAEAHALRG